MAVLHNQIGDFMQDFRERRRLKGSFLATGHYQAHARYPISAIVSKRGRFGLALDSEGDKGIEDAEPEEEGAVLSKSEDYLPRARLSTTSELQSTTTLVSEQYLPFATQSKTSIITTSSIPATSESPKRSMQTFTPPSPLLEPMTIVTARTTRQSLLTSQVSEVSQAVLSLDNESPEVTTIHHTSFRTEAVTSFVNPLIASISTGVNRNGKAASKAGSTIESAILPTRSSNSTSTTSLPSVESPETQNPNPPMIIGIVLASIVAISFLASAAAWIVRANRRRRNHKLARLGLTLDGELGDPRINEDIFVPEPVWFGEKEAAQKKVYEDPTERNRARTPSLSISRARTIMRRFSDHRMMNRTPSFHVPTFVQYSLAPGPYVAITSPQPAFVPRSDGSLVTRTGLNSRRVSMYHLGNVQPPHNIQSIPPDSAPYVDRPLPNPFSDPEPITEPYYHPTTPCPELDDQIMQKEIDHTAQIWEIDLNSPRTVDNNQKRTKSVTESFDNEAFQHVNFEEEEKISTDLGTVTQSYGADGWAWSLTNGLASAFQAVKDGVNLGIPQRAPVIEEPKPSVCQVRDSMIAPTPMLNEEGFEKWMETKDWAENGMKTPRPGGETKEGAESPYVGRLTVEDKLKRMKEMRKGL